MIGRTVSHYKITEKLGQGGMGVVYKAEDSKLGRRVALKFLPPEWTRDADAKARFLHEAQSAAALNHPSICTIYEIDEADGHTFIAMALIEGESLKDRIERGPLRLHDALDLAIQIADGLWAAHAKGIVHRDIKPGNVMVTPEGRARIMDFGLAKSPNQTRLTRTGSTTGTAAYMSPEQSRTEDVDHRTDIWSFGVLLYEMITGQRPFRGDYEQAVVHSILNEEPEPMTGLRTGVPMELERIAKKAMTKRLDERYQHMDDMLADLTALKRSFESATIMTSAAASERPPARGGTSTGRRRVAIGALILAAAAVAAVLIVPRLSHRASSGGPDRVVVVPFENRTGDPSLDAVGSMAADWITTGLAQTGTADVVPTAIVAGLETEGTRQGRDATGVRRALAKDTGASIVVSGSYYISGDSLRFRAEITDAARGALIRAIPETGGPRGNPMVAIERLKQRVMGALAMHLGAASVGAWVGGGGPPTYEAYREFSTAMSLFGADYPAAIAHFTRAAEMDTSFIPPRIYTVFCYANLGEYAKADSLRRLVDRKRSRLSPYEALFLDYTAAALRGNRGEALRIIRQLETIAPSDTVVKITIGIVALSLNRPREAVAAVSPVGLHAGLARVYAGSWGYSTWMDALDVLGDYDEELAVARRARQAYPDVMWLRGKEARALVGLGRLDEVTALMNEALASSSSRASTPASVIDAAAQALRAHGHKKESIEMADRAVEWRASRVEGKSPADDPAAFASLAGSLYAAERWDEARAIFERLAAADSTDMEVKGYLGVLAAREGKERDARRSLEELRQSRRPYLYGGNLYWCACIAAQLGERDRAVQFLREAFSQGAAMAPLPREDMDLEPLHGYKPFEELMKPKG